MSTGELRERESRAVSLLRALLHTAEDEWGVDTYHFEASHAAQEFLDGLSGAPQEPSAEEPEDVWWTLLASSVVALRGQFDQCSATTQEAILDASQAVVNLTDRPVRPGGESLARAPRDAEPVAWLMWAWADDRTHGDPMNLYLHTEKAKADRDAQEHAQHYGADIELVPLYATPPESEAPAWNWANVNQWLAQHGYEKAPLDGWDSRPASPTEPETEGGRDG